MKNVKIDENFSKVLDIDPIAEIEKIFGIDYKSFSQDQNMTMLGNAFMINNFKNNYLKNLGDTHFNMKWNEFLDLIKAYGFVEGLHYYFDYEDKKEQAIIYYHPIKGLVIWATSFWNGEDVNGGTLYGQVKYTKNEIEYVEKKSEFWANTYREMVMTEELHTAYKSLNGCSHDTFMDIGNGISFSYDIREALINKINLLENHFEFCNPWAKDQFLWFVDFIEDDVEGYDYKKITLEKIQRCPEEFQKMVKVYTDKYSV